MRPSRLTLPALAMLMAVTMSACTGAGSSATPSTPTTSTSSTTATVGGPSPSSSPSLSREQQATIDAEAAYRRYREAIDAVYGRGGSDARAEFTRIAAGPALNHLIEQAGQIKKLGWRQVSGVTTKSLKVQSVSFEKGRLPQATLVACVDGSTRRAVDEKGKDVTRKGASPFSNDFVVVTKFNDKGWLVTQDESTEAKAC